MRWLLRLSIMLIAMQMALYAQNGELVVKVQDGDRPLPEATVLVGEGADRVGGATNAVGEVRLTLVASALSNGRVHLEVRRMGYAPIDTLCTWTNSIIIRMREEAQVLEAVTVKGFRRINKGDALNQVYEVDRRSLLKTAKAPDALKALPGVIGDGSDFRILGNRQNAKIYIDGVEASSAQVSILDAGQIARIEVKPIDLERGETGGSINIIKRESSNPQFKGEVTLGSSTRLGYRAVPSLNFQNKKVDISATYSQSLYKQKSTSELFLEMHSAQRF